jgi:hypothetical protein
VRLRLNIWQRLGVVASVLWAIGGYLSEMMRAEALASHVAFDPCTAGPTWLPNCGNATYTAMMHDAWQNGLAVGLIPIPLGWLAAYIVVWTTRWVWAGRKTA